MKTILNPLNLNEKRIFSIQKGYSGRETLAIINGATKFGANVIWEKKASLGTIPIGSIEYCDPIFGEHRKDFYPNFLKHMLYRNITLEKGPLILNQNKFVKSSLNWKNSFHSCLKPKGEKILNGNWWISDPVNFLQEWRYYIAEGSVITTGWYLGTNENEPAPNLDINWNKNFSGAVDFGKLQNNKIALVECHAPFACGWYGENDDDYVFWQIIAWESRNWWLS